MLLADNLRSERGKHPPSEACWEKRQDFPVAGTILWKYMEGHLTKDDLRAALRVFELRVTLMIGLMATMLPVAFLAVLSFAGKGK